MKAFAASFVSAFQASVDVALNNLYQEVFGHDGVRELVLVGCKPAHLAVLTQIFDDVPHLAKVLLRYNPTQGDFAEYLVGIAWKDFKYGLLAQQRQAAKEAARDHSAPLEFEDGETASVDAAREAAANPARRAEGSALLESLQAVVKIWAAADTQQDSQANQPKRCEVYQLLVDGLLDGSVTRTTSGRLSVPLGQKEIALLVGSNEVYIRRWMADFRGHLDRFRDEWQQ